MSSRICGPASAAPGRAAGRRWSASVDQVMTEIEAYRKMGIRAFVLLGLSAP
jgi:hypothetical protein